MSIGNLTLSLVERRSIIIEMINFQISSMLEVGDLSLYKERSITDKNYDQRNQEMQDLPKSRTYPGIGSG